MTDFHHLIVARSSVPLIELADAKKHLRFDSDDEDDNIQRMISSVTAEIEGYLDRFLIETEIEQPYPGWGPGAVITLPFAPVLSVEGVKYFDQANEIQTLSSSDYEWINAAVSSVICEAKGKSWPTVYDRLAPVVIVMKCGYGSLAADVPSDIIDAAYLLLFNKFHHRGSMIEQNKVVVDLLSRHRFYK